MSRSAIAIGVGLLAGVLTIVAIKLLGDSLFGTEQLLPAGASEGGEPALALPGTYIFLLLAWALGTMHGAGLAAHLAYRSRVMHGLVVGAVLLVAAIWQMTTFPHPTWFAVIGVLLFLPSAWVGAKIGTQPLPGHREGWIVKEAPNYSQM